MTSKELPHFIMATISRNRFDPYLREAGFDHERALQLYMWNMNISASLFPLIATIEIAMRNKVVARLESSFSATWWRNEDFHASLGTKGKGILLRAENAIKQRDKTPDSGRMTAELTFGFWQNMFLAKYEAALWRSLHLDFADLPSWVMLAELYKRTKQVNDLRNRISHHEPMMRTNISQSFADALTVLSWMSREKAAWIRPQLLTQQLLRKKP